MDAIVYGVIVSLGFATFENISYVYSGNFEVDSFSLAIMRAVSAIPMHATCGIIMGYFFGLYAFTHSKQFLIKSIIFPIGIHATYNFLTGYDFFFLYFLVAVMVYARGLHTEFAELQLKKAREDETKVI
jgi:RsiW-degrading membrane proteinase PrsW (M82 family)